MKKVPQKLWLIFVLGMFCPAVSQILSRYFTISDTVLGIIQGIGIGLLLVFISNLIRFRKRQDKDGVIE